MTSTLHFYSNIQNKKSSKINPSPIPPKKYKRRKQLDLITLLNIKLYQPILNSRKREGSKVISQHLYEN